MEIVKQAMHDVTLPGGTAVLVGAGAPYGVAAKTGTAQVIGIKQNEKYDESKIDERHRDHALFIAFAPLDAPKIAVAVIVENGSHGGSTAGPIARKVMDYYLLGKMPDPPKESKPVPVRQPAPALQPDEEHAHG
jgi:penicillin-binding protein 2